MITGKRTKIGSVLLGCSSLSFLGGLFGIPAEVAWAFMSAGMGFGLWGIYERNKVHHLELRKVTEEAPKILDEAFFRTTHKGKRVSRMGTGIMRG